MPVSEAKGTLVNITGTNIPSGRILSRRVSQQLVNLAKIARNGIRFRPDYGSRHQADEIRFLPDHGSRAGLTESVAMGY